MRKSNSKRVNYRWIPFIFILIYITITLSISFWGPLQYYNYDIYKKMLVFIYVVFFLIFTWFGMITGFNSSKKVNCKIAEMKRRSFLKNIGKIAFIVLLNKGALFISCIKLYGIPDFTNLFSVLAKTYDQKNLGGFADRNIFRQIDTFTTFLYIISVCGILYYWEKVNKRVRLIMIINILLTFLYTTLYIGDQKPFMDVMIYIISAVLITKIKKGKKVVSFKNIIIFIFLSVTAILFFSTVVINRRLLWGSAQSTSIGNFITINLKHPLLGLFSEKLRYQIGFFLIYPTMGWYGLSLTLQLPFQWSYFLGSARGLNDILSQFMPNLPDMYNTTYLGRMELQFGYDGLSNWHTIFPWLASDFTFVGTLIFMGIVAHIYARSWKEAIENDNPISFIMVATLNIMYLYITANNQLFVQRGSTVATLVILGFWFLKGKYYNIMIERN